MSKKLILLNIIIIVIMSRFENSYEECLCNNIRLRGEYCGTELNRRNGNNECLPDHMYFCSDTISGIGAKQLLKCNDVYECEQNQFTFSNRARRRNPCLRRMRCQCPTSIGRGPHCGSKLVGADCPHDMLFICRPRTGWDSRDYCPDGCNDGKCLIGVDGDNQRIRGKDMETSDNESDDEEP